MHAMISCSSTTKLRAVTHSSCHSSTKHVLLSNLQDKALEDKPSEEFWRTWRSPEDLHLLGLSVILTLLNLLLCCKKKKKEKRGHKEIRLEKVVKKGSSDRKPTHDKLTKQTRSNLAFRILFKSISACLGNLRYPEDCSTLQQLLRQQVNEMMKN